MCHSGLAAVQPSEQQLPKSLRSNKGLWSGEEQPELRAQERVQAARALGVHAPRCCQLFFSGPVG
eukprot:8410131-Lingulodinium_polyedra.AAC.1